MRDYIARDPRTGKPLKVGGKRKKSVNLSYKPEEGPWDAIPLDRILPLATGRTSAESVIWKDSERLLSRTDGVRALPRIRGRAQEDAHSALEIALGDIDPRLRIAGLFSLPYCALQQSSKLFEHLHELVDDIDIDVRKSAQSCLVVVAPVFPSATEETLRKELRNNIAVRRRNAFLALRGVADAWPEVAELHIDELIREEDVDLRTQASALLPRLAKHKSPTIWDLIGWCLQDENAAVRRNSAKSLMPLAEHAPKVAQIALEISLFDEDEQVRMLALKAFKKMDPTSYRMQRLLMNGTRHRDRNIRINCIKMLPIVLVDAELRALAVELSQQETDIEIRKLLSEMMIDESLEGSEDEKNAFLAPAEKAQSDEGTISTPPESALESASRLKESEPKPPISPTSASERRPTQDELYYGDDDDDDFEL